MIGRGVQQPVRKDGLRVLALVTDAFGGYGGIAQYNRDFIRALAELPQVSAIDVLPRLAPGQREPMPSIVRQYGAVHSRIGYSISAMSLVAQKRPDIIFNGHLYHGALALNLAWMARARLVSQLHGTEIWEEVSPLLRRALEASSLVLAVSRDTRARLLAQADNDPSRVLVLNNTVEPDFTPGDRASARARLGLSDQFAVLTVSRLDPRDGYKGHDQIIPLIAHHRAQGLDICYLIAGVGEDQPRLEKLAQTCGVAAQIRFLGKVLPEDLPDLYRAANLFALPSRGEGFGIAFLEAMACGTPAIGLNVGGAADALGGGELGMCVRQDALADAFASAISAAIKGQRAPNQAVQARFGWPTFQSRVAQVMALV